MTQRVKIRAGSCVLPLHHPIRVAEEWAFVDNISQGRVGVSFASGWQPNDFVHRAGRLRQPQERDARQHRGGPAPVARRNASRSRVRWASPSTSRPCPRPIQKDLPIWLTAAGNPETFQQAGELGCHLLTHLLGQNIDDVAEKIRLYRVAWHRAGPSGQRPCDAHAAHLRRPQRG